jgi:hypothetical protein
MQIPNLPTDNFYKFLTILGLSILIGAGYLLFLENSKHIDTIELRKQEAKHHARVYYLQKEIQSIMQQYPDIKVIEKEQGIKTTTFQSYWTDKGKVPPVIWFAHFSSNNDSLKKQVADLNKLGETYALEQYYLELYKYAWLDDEYNLDIARWRLFYFVLIGLFTFIWGFIIWYKSESRKKAPNAGADL